MPRAFAIRLLPLFLSFATCFTTASASPLGELRCDLLEFSADELFCDGRSCSLSGNTHLTCNDAVLKAESVTIEFDETGGFEGLEARDKVEFTTPLATILCQELSLDKDRIQGTIRDALLTLHERRPDGSRGSKATIEGSIERSAETLYTLSPASISLCDCGSDVIPSWSIKATSIDVDMADRALLYFPSLWISPLGLFEMPVLPILAPISIPLERRAFGFLPPVLRFYDDLAPGVAIPLFIPVDETWDLTVSLGNRFDWTPPRLTAWKELAAPTMDLRLRYHPTKTIKGQADISWVYDRFHGNALNRHKSRIDALNDIRYDLQKRLSIRARHSWRDKSQSGVFADVQWTSDDLLLSDQALKYDDRIAYYLPSRLQWFYDAPKWRVDISATHLQRLYNYDTDNHRSALNFGSHELDELSMGPMVVGYIKPIQLTEWLTLDSTTEIVRVGPSRLSSPIDSRWLMSKAMGLYASYYRDSLRYSASQKLRFSLTPTDSTMKPLAASLSQFEISSPWRGEFTQLIHSLWPALELLHIQRFTEAEAIPTYLPESELRTSSTLLFKLGQELRARATNKARLALEAQVPFDLSEGAWMPLRIVSQLKGVEKFKSRLALTISPRGTTFRDVTMSLQWRPNSKFRLGTDYLLLAPEASRFQASIWEMAGNELRETTSSGWIHGIRPKLTLKISDSFALNYRADVGLPLRDSEDNTAAEVVLHSLGIQLTSQCHHCWDLEVKTQIRPESTKSATDIQLQIALSLGGFEISP